MPLSSARIRFFLCDIGLDYTTGRHTEGLLLCAPWPAASGSVFGLHRYPAPLSGFDLSDGGRETVESLCRWNPSTEFKHSLECCQQSAYGLPARQYGTREPTRQQGQRALQIPIPKKTSIYRIVLWNYLFAIISCCNLDWVALVSPCSTERTASGKKKYYEQDPKRHTHQESEKD